MVLLIVACLTMIVAALIILPTLLDAREDHVALTKPKDDGWTSPLKGEIPRDFLPAAYPLDREVRGGFTKGGGIPVISRRDVEKYGHLVAISSRKDEEDYLDRLIRAHGQEDGYSMFLDHRNECIERKRKEDDHKLLVKALYDGVDKDNQSFKELNP